MRAFAAFCLLACLAMTGCSPAEGSPGWCRKMMNRPQVNWTPHEAEVFATKCGSALVN